MKNLRLRRLWILSLREKKARQESFSPTTTVVFGENDTGKSHLIKSIYAAFGADASVINEKWAEAGVSLLLEFTVDDEHFSILRVDNQFALFDAADALIWAGSGLVKSVGPQIGKLLNFKIQIAIKSDVLVTPPPQFCFLPFYQDQDRGWDDTWSSFKGLEMISGYKKSILEYHTGIRPREYYEAQAAKGEAVRFQTELKSERRALDRATDRLQANRAPLTIAFTPELFAQQLEELLSELNVVRSVYDGIKQNISALQSRRAVLVEEIEIARTALTELDADFKFVQEIAETQVICPTCNTVHENDFANRFGLVSDADACRGFLASARHSLNEVEADIERHLGSLREYGGRAARIEQILEETRGKIKLRDMLTSESERMLDATLATERTVIDQGISEWQIKANEAADLMKAHSSARRKAEIIAFYAKKLRTFASELGVEFSAAALKSVSPKINETGSYGPRAILAYHYALLHTIREFTTSCLCPIIIDTPLQQDQDEKNASAILSFALKNCPKDMQLVLGTVSMHGVDYSGHSINPVNKEALLNRDDFEDVNSYMRPFMNKMLAQDQGDNI